MPKACVDSCPAAHFADEQLVCRPCRSVLSALFCFETKSTTLSAVLVRKTGLTLCVFVVQDTVCCFLFGSCFGTYTMCVIESNRLILLGGFSYVSDSSRVPVRSQSSRSTNRFQLFHLSILVVTLVKQTALFCSFLTPLVRSFADHLQVYNLRPGPKPFSSKPATRSEATLPAAAALGWQRRVPPATRGISWMAPPA